MDKILHRRGGKNHPRLYPGTRYCSAGEADLPSNCIPIRAYAEKYYVSQEQILGMLKRGELRAVTFKRKLFVLDIRPEPKCKFST
jgi:hypothetical protein